MEIVYGKSRGCLANVLATCLFFCECFNIISCYLSFLWVTPIQYNLMEEKLMIECTWAQLTLIGLSGIEKYDSLEL